MVETMRVESEQETPTQKKNRESFAAELGNGSSLNQIYTVYMCESFQDYS